MRLNASDASSAKFLVMNRHESAKRVAVINHPVSCRLAAKDPQSSPRAQIGFSYLQCREYLVFREIGVHGSEYNRTDEIRS